MHVVIVANGTIDDHARSRAIAAQADLLFCADGGANHVMAWGLIPDAVVGDMDSLDVEALERLTRAGVELERHPPHKDATDLELALERAVDSGATDIIVLGALGGRIDQTLGNIMLLAHPRLANVPVHILGDRERIMLIRGEVTIQGRPGDTVSLLPLSAEVTHVTTEGLEYPLRDESLYRNSSRGISNVLSGVEATITMGEGVLLLTHHTQAPD
jgi:thiamine pyrophosphokinase